MRITVKSNISKLSRMIGISDNIYRRATKDALNKTAFQGRKRLIKSLDENFIIRRPWTEKGMIVSTASASNLVSIVGSKRPYMRDQAIGGKVKAYQNIPGVGKRVAVPSVGSKNAIRKTEKAVITKKKLASSLVNSKLKNKPFVVKMKNGKHGIFIKTGKLKKSKRKYSTPRKVRSRTPIKLLYTLAKSTRLKKKWPMQKMIEKIVENNININLISKLEAEYNKLTLG